MVTPVSLLRQQGVYFTPALIDQSKRIDTPVRIAPENLGGWVSESWDRDADDQARQRSKALALNLGARS